MGRRLGRSPPARGLPCRIAFVAIGGAAGRSIVARLCKQAGSTRRHVRRGIAKDPGPGIHQIPPLANRRVLGGHGQHGRADRSLGRGPRRPTERQYSDGHGLGGCGCGEPNLRLLNCLYCSWPASPLTVAANDERPSIHSRMNAMLSRMCSCACIIWSTSNTRASNRAASALLAASFAGSINVHDTQRRSAATARWSIPSGTSLHQLYGRRVAASVALSEGRMACDWRSRTGGASREMTRSESLEVEGAVMAP